MTTKFYLIVAHGDNIGKIMPLESGSNLIGRWDPETGAFPEIDLSNDDPDIKVSRKHAVIECSDKGAVLQDLGSLNGTFVNRDKRLEGEERAELKHDDEIIIGKTVLRFEVGR